MILSVINSLIPVFLVILVGWLTRVTGFVSPESWNGFERVTYHILIPSLILTTLAMADLRSLPYGAVAASLLAPVVALTLLVSLARPMLERHLAIPGPAYTSLLQGTIRWNSFIALALAIQLHGTEGATVAAIGFAVLVPVVNLISAHALARYGEKPVTQGLGRLVLTVVKNPFVWPTLTGLAINIVMLPVPKPITSFGDILGRSALAAGLLLVGSGLDIRALTKLRADLLVSIVLKLLISPLIAGCVGSALGLKGAALAVTVLCSAVPTAAGAYVLARQSGGDAPLMAAIITAQTIVAALTLPLMLWLFG